MRHGTPETLLAAPLAILVLAIVGCGSSDDHTTTGKRALAAAATATAPSVTRTTATATATSTPASRTSTTSSAPDSLVGSNGKMYRCIGSSLLSDLRTTSRRIDRGRRSLKRIRAELSGLKRRYPNKVAPPRVAQRYNYLVRKHNALLHLGNRRVRAYNARLEHDCVKG